MKLKYPVEDGDNKYLLQIESFDAKILREVGIEEPTELYDIVLERIEGSSISSLSTLSKISTILKIFMQDNPGAILYFYCDDQHDIKRSARNKEMSPQEYRSRLFTTMFDNEKRRSQGSFRFVNNQIVIKTMEGIAYIHLISREDDTYVAEIIQKEIKAQSKDETSVNLF